MTQPGDGTLDARWPDGVRMRLVAAPAGPQALRLGCRVEVDGAATVDAVGVRLLGVVGERILVDGYHSWDWAGVRDGTVPGAGWWSCITAPPAGRLLAVRPASAPRHGATALSWDGAGALDALTTGEPDQAGTRTGPPGPLGVRLGAGEGVAGDGIVVETLDDAARRGAGLPPRAPGAAPLAARSAGWMSWNCLGPAVSTEDVVCAADELVPPGGVVLLDDGWMPVWGDWVEREGFGSIADLARRVRGRGRRLGVWLAPFLVDPVSETARTHADALLRDATGDVLVDTRPPRPHHVLDGNHEGARALLVEVAERLGRTGVSVLKLDFLYAGALTGGRARGAQSSAGVAALRAGLADLVHAFRAHAGNDAAVWACGAPAPCVVGLADACRSGGDAVVNVPTAHGPAPDGPPFAFGEAVVLAQERNLAARAWLWGATLPCDVDAVTLGPVAGTPAADDVLAERWLRLARRSGGPLLNSDLSGLEPERLRRLRDAQEAVAGQAPRPARPTDPLALEPAPMGDDDFYCSPGALPTSWDG